MNIASFHTHTYYYIYLCYIQLNCNYKLVSIFFSLYISIWGMKRMKGIELENRLTTSTALSQCAKTTETSPVTAQLTSHTVRDPMANRPCVAVQFCTKSTGRNTNNYINFPNRIIIHFDELKSEDDIETYFQYIFHILLLAIRNCTRNSRWGNEQNEKRKLISTQSVNIEGDFFRLAVNFSVRMNMCLCATCCWLGGRCGAENRIYPIERVIVELSDRARTTIMLAMMRAEWYTNACQTPHHMANSMIWE